MVANDHVQWQSSRSDFNVQTMRNDVTLRKFTHCLKCDDAMMKNIFEGFVKPASVPYDDTFHKVKKTANGWYWYYDSKGACRMKLDKKAQKTIVRLGIFFSIRMKMKGA